MQRYIKEVYVKVHFMNKSSVPDVDELVYFLSMVSFGDCLGNSFARIAETLPLLFYLFPVEISMYNGIM